MGKCIQKVTQTQYLKAMRLTDKSLGGIADKTMLQRLWTSTSWIMSTEICRELMTYERISLLTDSIFKTYEDIYLTDKAWPSKENWDLVNSENRGIVLARGVLHTHYVGKTTSLYKHVEYNKDKADEADKKSRDSTPFNGMQTEGKLRAWVEPEEQSPIDSW
jgi:hypothetical protein